MLNKVSYTGLYLTKNSRDMLKRLSNSILKKLNVNFDKRIIGNFCHHMFITKGILAESRYYDKFDMGDQYPLSITHFSYDYKRGVLIFKVKTTIPSDKKVKHIVAYIDKNSKNLYSKKNKWIKLNNWLNLLGTIEQFSSKSKEPLPIKTYNLFESKLYGEDLSLIKNDVLLVVDRNNEVIGYGYNILEILLEMKLLKNKEYFNLNGLKAIFKKYKIEIVAVTSNIFKLIKDNDFKIKYSYTNLLEELDFFDLLDNVRKVNTDIFKRNILLGDSNSTGRGTDMDKATVTQLVEKLSQCNVPSNISLTIAKDMQKNGIKKGLQNAFSKGLISNIYNIEERFDSNIEGDYYINDFLFATYKIIL